MSAVLGGVVLASIVVCVWATVDVLRRPSALWGPGPRRAIWGILPLAFLAAGILSGVLLILAPGPILAAVYLVRVRPRLAPRAVPGGDG